VCNRQLRQLDGHGLPIAFQDAARLQFKGKEIELVGVVFESIHLCFQTGICVATNVPAVVGVGFALFFRRPLTGNGKGHLTRRQTVPSCNAASENSGGSEVNSAASNEVGPFISALPNHALDLKTTPRKSAPSRKFAARK